MCSFDFYCQKLNFYESFLTAARAPPRVFKITERNLLKAGCAEFGRLHFYFGRNQFVRRTSSGQYKFFTRYSKGAVLLNIKWPRKRAQAYGKSATGAGRIIGPLSGGSTRTCDQSDLRKRHIHFGRRNSSA